MTGSVLTWSPGGVRLVFAVGPGEPVALLSLRPTGTPRAPSDVRSGPPLVEVQALWHGRLPGGHRYAATTIGSRLRYRDHVVSDGCLRVVQTDPVTGLVVTSAFEAVGGVPAVRAWTEVAVVGTAKLRLHAVTSIATGAFLFDAGRTVDEMDLVHGDSDQAAESRWHRTPLPAAGLTAMDPAAHQPTGVLVARDDSWALSWQVEHNGAWHWEVGETVSGAYLAVLGPTDAEHQWDVEVSAGQGFTTVPVSLAVAAGGVDDALAALTRQRRATARHRRSPELPVIFNGHLDALTGDPTTEKLLPLVDAAAAAGADYFCVDEDWWAGVGERRASATRFPDGFGEVVDHIRARGMSPGIRLEPEVVGIRSEVAMRLPHEAFFQRGGGRVVEHGRFHLDLRHPAAVAHLDEVVDRLVEGFGIEFFKLDHNTVPSSGTDVGGLSPGAGLLGHNRAYLDWLDALLTRYPDLLVENCAAAPNPSISAPAQASVLPEQRGGWAHAQPGVTTAEAAFTLATGILGRLYLSGRVDLMRPEWLHLARQAVTVHKRLRPEISAATPFWPFGLTGPRGPWVAQGLRRAGDTYLTLGCLPGAPAEVEVPIAHLRDVDVSVGRLFPPASDWSLHWRRDRGALHVTREATTPTSAVIHLART